MFTQRAGGGGGEEGGGMMMGSMSHFPSIQKEKSFLNLEIDEGKRRGASREAIMSHISSIPSKMSSILRCIVILYPTKKEKMLTFQL